MSLKSIRDSVIGKLVPRPEPEAIESNALPAEERKQIEVQEMNTDAVRNNYLMRDYLMSLPEEERQKYMDAQNSNPAIEQYKENIGADKHFNEQPTAEAPKPNDEYYKDPDEAPIIAPQPVHSLVQNKL